MALTFKGTNDGGFGGYDLTDQLLYNIKWWLDWGLAHQGAYGIYQYSDASYYDDDEAKLHLAFDERYPSGIVWEGAGREWIWESGISVASGDIAPFRVSGVYINGDFYPTATTTGTYEHHIDYQHGRVIFENPQGVDEDIRVEYARRSVFVGFDDSEEFRTLMRDALEEFLGDAETVSKPVREHQVWLPSIFIGIDEGRQTGFQLGGGQIKTRVITAHVFADNPSDRNLLMDWLDFQSRAAFNMADLNDITFPFDEYGDVASGVTNWPDMATDHPYRKLRLQDATCRRINSLGGDLFMAKVQWEAEIDIGSI